MGAATPTTEGQLHLPATVVQSTEQDDGRHLMMISNEELVASNPLYQHLIDLNANDFAVN